MSGRSKILIVDDDDHNVRLLEAMLIPMGHEIFTARDGEDGLKAVTAHSPDLILLDIMMPKINGFDVARMLKERNETRGIPIVMVTALDEVEDRVKCLEAGADDFLSKPVDKTELTARVRSLLEVKAYHDHQGRYQKLLEAEVNQKTRQLREALEKAKLSSLETVIRLCLAVDSKDHETGSHIRRISQCAAAIARKAGLSERDAEHLLYAAPMHDIGKIGIPGHILTKPGPLDAAEWEIMKRHTTIGAKILSGSSEDFIQLAEAIARTHHERWNGSGYPEGLKGEQIPVCGRVTAVADVFDAMTSDRPYRRAHSDDETFDHIRGGAGVLFDPDIVRAFLSLGDEMIGLKNDGRDSEVNDMISLLKTFRAGED